METLSHLTSLSIILLAFEMFIMMIIPGAIFFFSLRGLFALERKMKEVSPKVQGFFRDADRVTRQVSDKMAEPFIRVSETSAQIQTMGRRSVSLLKRREV
jgi:hypothetical protein